MKKNHSIVLLCIFRITPSRQALLQALPLKKKGKAKVVHAGIDPSQSDAQPNGYSNGFQITGEPPVIKSSLVGKKTNCIDTGEYCIKSVISKTPPYQQNDYSSKNGKCEACRHNSQI